MLDSILREPSPREWVANVIKHFDLFLLDHAACERKASALAMSFVVKYSDRHDIVDHMVSLSIEELKHFQEVVRIIKLRELSLSRKDEADLYVNKILSSLRHGREERLLDRLIMSAVIEARGHERFSILADTLQDIELKSFYSRLSKEEFGHCHIFIRLAKQYFADDVVCEALERISKYESDAMLKTPITHRLH